MNATIPGVEKRLLDRYQQLVREHCGSAQPLAAGPRILPEQSSSHAAAMAAWRFYLNPRTTFTRLAQPLLDAAADSASRHCQDFALVPIDWSVLDYRDHPSKTDRTQVGNSKTLGYKLLSALLLEKAVYELGYELNNRPEWMGIPLKGILEMLSPTSSPVSGESSGPGPDAPDIPG